MSERDTSEPTQPSAGRPEDEPADSARPTAPASDTAAKVADAVAGEVAGEAADGSASTPRGGETVREPAGEAVGDQRGARPGERAEGRTEPSDPAPADRPDAASEPAADVRDTRPRTPDGTPGQRPVTLSGERGRHAVARRPAHPPVRSPAPPAPSGRPAGTISGPPRPAAGPVGQQPQVPPARPAGPTAPNAPTPPPRPSAPPEPRQAERPAAPPLVPPPLVPPARSAAPPPPAPGPAASPAQPPRETQAPRETPRQASPASEATPGQRLAAVLWPPRVSRGQLVAGLLLAVLGAALAIQVTANSDDSQLRNARQSDLVRILDDVNDRTARLTDEQRQLQASEAKLQSSSDRSKAALEQAQQRSSALGILAGTVPATGPGVTLTVLDPQRGIKAAQLLDALQELRNAGAEAIQLNAVRVVADTSFVDGPSAGQIVVSGQTLSPPYVYKAIGDPAGIDTALKIPGGVVAVLQEKGAQANVTRSQHILIDALHDIGQPRYSRPASNGG
jgi:uncharacterized protein YlxW (UPF0749 family)